MSLTTLFNNAAVNNLGFVDNAVNTEFDVCYGDYESNTFKFADLNGELNGGQYYITFIDMAATW